MTDEEYAAILKEVRKQGRIAGAHTRSAGLPPGGVEALPGYAYGPDRLDEEEEEEEHSLKVAQTHAEARLAENSARIKELEKTVNGLEPEVKQLADDWKKELARDPAARNSRLRTDLERHRGELKQAEKEAAHCRIEAERLDQEVRRTRVGIEGLPARYKEYRDTARNEFRVAFDTARNKRGLLARIINWFKISK